MNRDADVAVVGAGPAGTAAAITLARLGLSVVLLDKATFPRDKCCGDGLTTAALRRLESLGLDPASVESWEVVDEAIVASQGRVLRLPLPVGAGQFAASARRVDLDAALVRLAEGAGVVLVEEAAVEGVRLVDHGAVAAVSTAAGTEVRARYVIAADGMWSPLRKALGLGEAGYLGDWQAGRQYYVSAGHLARKLWVWFEPDVLPGYVWSFPLAGGSANVGYGVVRRDGEPLGALRGQRSEIVERPHIASVIGDDAVQTGPWKAWPIPARIASTELCGLEGRVLFVGDAARACDPMTGEGIAQALETGELAARAVAWAGPLDAPAAARRYSRQVRFGLAVDDSLARFLSRALSHRRGALAALAIAGTSGWTRRNFVRWMFEDYPRSAVVTPHRWERGLFTRPGAFASRA